jgi:hypothetical protein
MSTKHPIKLAAMATQSSLVKTTTAAAAPVQRPSYLLKLRPELRLKVYSWLFVPRRYRLLLSDDGHKHLIQLQNVSEALEPQVQLLARVE